MCIESILEVVIGVPGRRQCVGLPMFVPVLLSSVLSRILYLPLMEFRIKTQDHYHGARGLMKGCNSITFFP